MNKAHRYFPLNKVEVGMILADDLLDKQGHMLLPAQTELNSAMLYSLAQHGVHQLSIQVDTPSPEQQQREQQHKLARLEQIFRLSQHQASNHVLYQLLLAYRQEESK